MLKLQRIFNPLFRYVYAKYVSASASNVNVNVGVNN